jgi:hypothetical protein
VVGECKQNGSNKGGYEYFSNKPEGKRVDTDRSGWNTLRMIKSESKRHITE